MNIPIARRIAMNGRGVARIVAIAMLLSFCSPQFASSNKVSDIKNLSSFLKGAN